MELTWQSKCEAAVLVAGETSFHRLSATTDIIMEGISARASFFPSHSEFFYNFSFLTHRTSDKLRYRLPGDDERSLPLPPVARADVSSPASAWFSWFIWIPFF
jgi:hypothetical protein